MAEETDAERIARLEAALEEAEEKITDIADKAENLATAPSKSGWDAFASTYIDKMSFNGQLGVIFAFTCCAAIVLYGFTDLFDKPGINSLWFLAIIALPAVFSIGCISRVSIERQVLEELDWTAGTQHSDEVDWIKYTPLAVTIAALSQLLFMYFFFTDSYFGIAFGFGKISGSGFSGSLLSKMEAMGLVFLFIFGSLSLGSSVIAMATQPFTRRHIGAQRYALVELSAIATGFAAVLAGLSAIFYLMSGAPENLLTTNGGLFVSTLDAYTAPSIGLMILNTALSIAAAAFSIGLLAFTKKEKEKAIERIKVEGGTEIDPSLADKEVKENVFSNISFDSDEVGLILAILLPSLLITALTFMFIGMKEAVIMGPLLVIILMVTAQLVKRKANAPPKVRGIGKQIIRRDSPPKKTKRDSSIPAGWTKEQYEQYGHISAEGMDED